MSNPDSIPPSSPQESGHANRADNKPAKKSLQKTTKQGSKSNRNKGIKSASIVATLTGFALLSFLFMFLWWLEDQLEKLHFGYSVPVICFVLFTIGIAGIAWLLIEIVGGAKFIKPISLILCVTFGGFLIANLKSFSPPEPKAAQGPPGPVIEGTRFTQKRLSEIFPFGYAVFFFGQNRILRNEIFKNGMMDWKLDVNAVVIEPDFYSGSVQWTIPNVNAATDGSGPHVSVNGGTIKVAAPLKEGCARRGGFLLANKPVLHVITLGDNQRTPVFAIGFRIPSEGEGRPPNPPYFFIQP